MTAYDALVARLRVRLAPGGTPLPGHAAHAEMAPFPGRMAPEIVGVEGKSGRRAATLVLLYPDAAGRPCLVLTLRQPSLRAHSGQVSLPGGAAEPGETAEDTARREAFEEVGAVVAPADVLGRLTPLYVPPSGFSVWPVVAALPVRPAFRPQESEVAAVLDAPVALFSDPAARRVRPRALAGTPAAGGSVLAAPTPAEFDVPFFAVGDAEHEVWGATAMMLAEFAAIAVTQG